MKRCNLKLKNTQTQTQTRNINHFQTKTNMLIFLEGNIGAGKTTLLSKLAENPEYEVVYEPVDEWMSMRATPTSDSIFELYYKDKQRYGFMFQMVALQTRISHIQKILSSNTNKIIISERSYFTDHEVFAKLLHDTKIISDDEYFVYKMWYDFLIGMLNPKVSGIIYLKASPQTCCSRITKRNRTGEGQIDFDYVKQVHDQHETWLTQNKGLCLPVFVCNGDVENLQVTQELTDFITTLTKFNQNTDC